MITEYIEESLRAIKSLDSQRSHLGQIVKYCRRQIRLGHKILICGNGGSAADAQHFAAELVGRFEKERKAIPCIALTTDTSILTALGNDYGYNQIFARQIEAYGAEGDVLIAISTSGGSSNVINAAKKARDMKIGIVAMTGPNHSGLGRLADKVICVHSERTCHVQEGHEVFLHYLAQELEKHCG